MPHPQAHAHAKARMEAAHVRPNAETYDFVLGQWVEHRNLEMCLQDLQNMFHAGVAPTMTSMSKVVTLAADTGRPRLALDLINAYEAGEVERLPPGVWLHVLISSVEEHFVRIASTARRLCSALRDPIDWAPIGCRYRACPPQVRKGRGG